MRLINCRDMAESIRRAIISNGNEIESEENVYGRWEFKLSGKPWKSYGAVRSKRLICRISEKMLDHGWTLTNAINISRSVSEKSVLLYSRSENQLSYLTQLGLSSPIACFIHFQKSLLFKICHKVSSNLKLIFLCGF